MRTSDVVIVDKNNALEAFRRLEAQDILRGVGAKLRERLPVRRLMLIVDALTRKSTHVKFYSVVLELMFPDRKTIRASSQRHTLRKAIREASSRLKRRTTSG